MGSRADNFVRDRMDVGESSGGPDFAGGHLDFSGRFDLNSHVYQDQNKGSDHKHGSYKQFEGQIPN